MPKSKEEKTYPFYVVKLNKKMYLNDDDGLKGTLVLEDATDYQTIREATDAAEIFGGFVLGVTQKATRLTEDEITGLMRTLEEC